MDRKKEKLVEELHKPARKNYARRKVIVRDIDETWQADLVDLKMYSKTNRGYTFLLTVIDVVSKYAWALPLKKDSSFFKECFQQNFQGRAHSTKLASGSRD